jgi:hypothetical protein
MTVFLYFIAATRSITGWLHKSIVSTDIVYNIQTESVLMNWRQLTNWIFKNRHEFVIVIAAVASFVVVWPVGDYGILDDWAFVKSLEHLHTKGHLVVLDWNPMSLTGHLVWGLLFTKCLGFSFTVTKIAEFCAGLLLALIVCRIPKRFGVHPNLAMFAGLAVLLNPLMLVHSFMFMTDITALLWQWLSVACLLFGLEKSGRRRAGLLAAGSIFWALSVLTRQHGVTVPIAFAAYLLLCDRPRLRLDIIAPFFLPGNWHAAHGIGLHQLIAGPNQSFQASSELVRDFVLDPWWFDLPYIFWSYAVYVGLFVIPLVLSIRWRDLPSLTAGRIAVLFLSIWVGVLLFVHYSIKGWYFPYIRNVVTSWGMFQPHEFVIGEREVLWDREWGMFIGLCGICAFFGWLTLILQQQSPSTSEEGSTPSTKKSEIRSLLILLFGTQFAYQPVVKVRTIR